VRISAWKSCLNVIRTAQLPTCALLLLLLLLLPPAPLLLQGWLLLFQQQAWHRYRNKSKHIRSMRELRRHAVALCLWKSKSVSAQSGTSDTKTRQMEPYTWKSKCV
jgi:hypothetical protein